MARTASIHTRQGVRLPVRAIQRPIILFREVGRRQVEAAIDELNEMVVASSADAG